MRNDLVWVVGEERLSKNDILTQDFMNRIYLGGDRQYGVGVGGKNLI